MTGLPKGWAWSTVGEAAPIAYGVGLQKNRRVATGQYPVIGSAGVSGMHAEWLVDGPVVIVGRKGNAGSVYLSTTPCWPIDTTYYMRPSSQLDAGFLYYQLKSLELRSLDSSTAVPSLRRQDLEAVRFAIPPLNEQRRIVAAIEEHFSRLDAAVASLARASSRCSAVETSWFATSLDGSWPEVTIDSACKVGSGSTPSRSQSRFWTGGTIPWVSSAAVSGGRITRPSALITESALKETSVKLWPAGTVLVAMYGEGKTRGSVGILDIESTCNQACAAIEAGEQVNPEYLRLILGSRYTENRELASGGVQPNLSLRLIREMRIPLPDLETQAAVVTTSTNLRASLESARTTIAVARTRAAALRRSILAAAFSGQLVPQDPSDEPASVLLERIAAERAAIGPTRRKKKAAT